MEEHFKISTGLKDLIGSGLITDNFVAVFELVKNSFDANAKEVKIIFSNLKKENPCITIIDNGKGMDYNDLIHKWLFVAYSAKKDGTEEEDKSLVESQINNSEDYRSKLRTKRYYAGAKGVGRFSCDRLGKKLNLISIKDEKNAKIENLEVDWAEFEKDQNDEFVNVPVKHRVLTKVDYEIKHGTILEISEISKEDWSRDNFIRLKDKLSKLIRPDLNSTSNGRAFKIILEVPEEKENDLEAYEKNIEKGEGALYRNTVNGEVKNFIFDDLGIRTTKVYSNISVDGSQVKTDLIDRDTFIYSVEETNNYDLLKDISIHLYFLNRSAKNIFTRRMGIDAVNYGNVFVYKNGFRVFPFGEPRNDLFELDARALQGFNRYIGTRNIIGQIEINGEAIGLQETTSRDGGLVKTLAFAQLKEFLVETLKGLEKYVVDITEWGVNNDDFDGLADDKSKTKLVKLISNITDDKQITSIKYNEDIIDIINQQEESSAKKLIKNFKRIATENNQRDLINDATKLEKALNSLALAKDSAEKESERIKVEKKKIEIDLEQEVRQSLFTKSVLGVETKELLSLQHHINHSSSRIELYLDKLLSAINTDASKEESIKIINKIILENKKVSTLSRFVTKANFNTFTSNLNDDIIVFIDEYVENVYKEYKDLLVNRQPFLIKVEVPDGLKFIRKFKPIEIIIIMDNIINNSLRAKAKTVKLIWSQIQQDEISLRISDDGIGISSDIVDKIFDFRFTTTEGSGLGLYHTKQIIEKMNGTIQVNNNVERGVEFILTFKR